MLNMLIRIPGYYPPDARRSLETLARNKKARGRGVFGHPQFDMIVSLLYSGRTPGEVQKLLSPYYPLSDAVLIAFRDNYLPDVIDILKRHGRGGELSVVGDGAEQDLLSFYRNLIRSQNYRRVMLEEVQKRNIQANKLTEEGLPIPGTTQFSSQVEQGIQECIRTEIELRKALSAILQGRDVYQAVEEIVRAAGELLLKRIREELSDSAAKEILPLLGRLLEKHMSDAITGALGETPTMIPTQGRLPSGDEIEVVEVE